MIDKDRPANTAPIDLHEVDALQEIQVSDNVLIRPMSENDAEEILRAIEKDASIREKVSVAAKMKSSEDVATQVSSYSSDPHLMRYVIEKDNEVVGLVSFWRDIDNPFDAPDNPDDYGFGYFLDPKHRGEGIATRAVEKLMQVASLNLKVDHFIAYCEDENKESVAVLQKLGFVGSDITLVEENHGWTERKYIKQ